MTHTYVCSLCATLNSMKAQSALLIFHRHKNHCEPKNNGIRGPCAPLGAICTTEAQCTPWCTRETIFFYTHGYKAVLPE